MSSEHTNNTKIRILEATWHLMESSNGVGVSMSKIAKQAGISRQALYLHFDSRIELIVATVHYVDEVKGLNERLKQFDQARSSLEQLDTCVDIWGNYMPEIYGIAKAMLNTRGTDEATATAWNGCMTGLRSVCEKIIKSLEDEQLLAKEWSSNEAIELMMSLISIQNWEQLTIEGGWSNDEYIRRMKILLKRALVKS